MQSSTGQYSTHAGDPAQPVQHSVMTASSFGFFLRGVVSPWERGSCFSSRGTIAADLAASDSVAMAGIILSILSLATPTAQAAACGGHPLSTRLLAPPARTRPYRAAIRVFTAAATSPDHRNYGGVVGVLPV